MRSALAFLTPLGGGRAPTPSTLDWFPLVGALIGLALGGTWWLADRIWPPLLSAAVVVVADLALTGMLHADGLVDSADGLLPHLDTDRRLTVMSEPTVGAFGVVVAAAAMLLRVAALAAMAPLIPLVVALWCTSRALMAIVARIVPYARGEGLASGFSGPLRFGLWGSAVVLVGASTTWAVSEAGHVGPVAAVTTALLAGSAVVALARRRIGGFTGDVLGAAGVVAETAGLMVAAARW